MKLLINRLQPSQLFLNKAKIKAVVDQIQEKGLHALPAIHVRHIGGILVLIDGHTRAYIAHISGETKINAVWETDHNDWILYRRFVEDVQLANILHVQDLGSRILSEGQYTSMRRSLLSNVFRPRIMNSGTNSDLVVK